MTPSCCCGYTAVDKLVNRHEERDAERRTQSAAAAAAEMSGAICRPRTVLLFQCLCKAAAEVAEAGSCRPHVAWEVEMRD